MLCGQRKGVKQTSVWFQIPSLFTLQPWTHCSTSPALWFYCASVFFTFQMGWQLNEMLLPGKALCGGMSWLWRFLVEPQGITLGVRGSGWGRYKTKGTCPCPPQSSRCRNSLSSQHWGHYQGRPSPLSHLLFRGRAVPGGLKGGQGVGGWVVDRAWMFGLGHPHMCMWVSHCTEQNGAGRNRRGRSRAPSVLCPESLQCEGRACFPSPFSHDDRFMRVGRCIQLFNNQLWGPTGGSSFLGLS